MSVVKNQLQSNFCSLILVISVLLFSLSQIKGQDVFTVSHRVEPFETRRQGLDQSDPCPGDVIVFTCMIMSQTSVNRVSWMTDIVGTEDLYIFDLGTDNPNTNRSDRAGISATLLSNETFILRIDLRTSVDVINGTGISCGEVDQRMIASSVVPVNIIGPASAPTIVTISPQGLTTLTVDMTVPNTGEICVDNYRATIMEDSVGGMRLSQEQVVTDATQNLYKFEFSELDLCGEMRPSYTATATAVTNGTEGATATFSTAINIDNTNIITSAVSATLMFTSAGISVTLSWKVIDQNIMNRFEVECRYIENQETLFNCTYHSTSVTQLSVMFAYDDGDFVGKGIMFTVTYQYLMCLDSRATNFTVQNVNSSLPREVPEQNAVRVDFNEALFDINLVEVMFSSNCTISTTVRYSNPAIIDIPSTGANTGRCRYAILLVTRDNGSQQVGYPIEGIFEIKGRSIVTTVIVVIVVIIVMTVAVVITLSVSVILCKRSQAGNTSSKFGCPASLCGSQSPANGDEHEVYGIGTDGIETTPNEVYGINTDDIKTTPNEVYGVSTDGIETTPNEVYGICTA